jgi:thioesterase domain-containing protein
VLHDGGWRPEDGALIRMRAGGDGPPFVLLHAFEGHLFLYNELADRLSVHHPVFGCQAVGLDDSAPPLGTVEEMAAHYLTLIDEQLGDGPIILGAMCFGAAVGLEMARRRCGAGKPTHLMLIDSAWDQVAASYVPGPRLRLRARASYEFARGKYWMRETIRMITGSPYARREARIRRHTAKAWYAYAPRPWDGRITMLSVHPKDPHARDWKSESLRLLAVGDFETIYVPGEHFTLLRAPQVWHLADAMVAAVNRPEITR